MRFLPVVALTLFLTFSWHAALAQSRVRIQVSDGYGNEIPSKSVDLTLDGRTQDVRKGQTIRLEYGVHTFRIRVSGFRDALEPIPINQPEQVVAIAMPLGAIDAPPPVCAIDGRVPPKAGATWARLFQLFGAYHADVPVIDGEFQFRELECGAYLIVVMGGDKCLALKTLETAPTLPPRIEIPISSATTRACSTTGN